MIEKHIVGQMNFNFESTVKKPTIRLSEKMVSDDTQEMDYQFPAQSRIDDLMENDPQSLAKLELKTVLNFKGVDNRFIFKLNDCRSSSLIDN
jgi:hypothetical protein